MVPRLWQWLVFFFTRPVRLSDLSALASRVKPKAKVIPVAEVPAEPIPVATAAAPPRERKAPRTGAGTAVVSSMFRPELEVGVSEQPLDTLPAALREELQRPSTGGLQGSLRDR